MTDFISNWWNSIPIVTRWWFAGVFGLTILANFRILVTPYDLVLGWDMVVKKFQVWRLITCFLFFGGLGFPFLIMLIMLYKYSSSLETGIFAGRTADYVWMLMLGMMMALPIGFYFRMPLLGEVMEFMIIYYWAREHPNIVVSFMFGLQFPAVYLPWVLVGFRLLMGGSIWAPMCGIVLGHIYFFLEVIYPNTGGARYIKTPLFLYHVMPADLNVGAHYQRAQPQRVWGQGQRLGADDHRD
eukprot:TRINITY_DN1798_c0_g4_i2.p1 TRINITY_DN1798_c0_g4~~TRINITY_DN1798_c0_g4_i2.p1  ORF type:complete len:241 (-),score=33.52 TRINITY_DN1798_c0_g4_i2:165-887(-)